MGEPRPIPVLPSGRRGLALAATCRLVEVKGRYEALANDPATDPTLRSYAGDTLREIVAELRRRNGRKAAA